jgi:selenocysteine lyase/cysteine desulfurase
MLDSLLTNESLRQREFPVARERIYLAHAAVCPLPGRVARAMTSYLARVARDGQFEHLQAGAEARTRELAAQLLEATSDEIAFVASTSAGLSLVAAGLPWRPGDNVLIAEGDFPANVYPWLNLGLRGIGVKTIPSRSDGQVTLEDVAARVDKDTRLVSLSSVHFTTGAPIDVDAIGQYLQSRGILFCVDAIQSLGALPLSVRHVDFLAADAHKWLLGPQGIGILYVRRSHFDLLHPAIVGWKSVIANRDYHMQRFEFPAAARRYEPGSLNAVGLVGLHAALSMLLHISVATIAKRLKKLRAFLVTQLLEKGYTIVGDPAPGIPSGITSFRAETEDVVAIQKRLEERGIVVSIRQDPSGNKCIRLAPHFYTTEEELAALLGQL